MPQITRDSEQRQVKHQQRIYELHRRRQEQKMLAVRERAWFEEMGGVVVDMALDIYGLLRSK